MAHVQHATAHSATHGAIWKWRRMGDDQHDITMYPAPSKRDLVVTGLKPLVGFALGVVVGYLMVVLI